jgi:hypothetical protein
VSPEATELTTIWRDGTALRRNRRGVTVRLPDVPPPAAAEASPAGCKWCRGAGCLHCEAEEAIEW